MSNPQRRRPGRRPRGAWLLCDDCASEVGTAWRGRTMLVLVRHSATCPYWRGRDGAELALALVPREDTRR